MSQAIATLRQRHSSRGWPQGRDELAGLKLVMNDTQGLRRSQRTWLRQRAELLDRDHLAWQRLGAQGEDAYLASRLLTGA